MNWGLLGTYVWLLSLSVGVGLLLDEVRALRRELRRPVNKAVVVERAREDLGDEGEKVRWIITSRIEGEE